MTQRNKLATPEKESDSGAVNEYVRMLNAGFRSDDHPEKDAEAAVSRAMKGVKMDFKMPDKA